MLLGFQFVAERIQNIHYAFYMKFTSIKDLYEEYLSKCSIKWFGKFNKKANTEILHTFTKLDQLNVLKIIFLTRTIPTFFMFFSP